MKRKIILSIALALTTAFGLHLNSVTSVRAQPQLRFRFETGVVKLGPNQILRITINWGDGAANSVRFGQTGYLPGACSTDGVCTLNGTNAYTGVTTLAQGDAASFDITPNFLGGIYVDFRGIVLTNRLNARVNASIIDATTGRVDEVVIGLLIP